MTVRLAVAACLLATAMPLARARQDSSYLASVERWRAEHEASLRADAGWLTVVGLEWLKPGPNRAGSDASADVKLPAGAPAAIGVFRLDGGQVTFEPASAAVLLNGKTASAQTLRPDVDKVTTGSLTLFVIRRGNRLGIRIRDRNSEARGKFAGETWYPVRASWRIIARFETYNPPKMIPILNVLGQEEPQPCPGAAVFAIDGKEYRLEPIAQGRQLFFIFSDATSGRATYGAGRFLFAALPQEGQVILDFNKAENPPCAFTSFATCPLPPKQNRLPIAIEAGEQHGANRH
jgi:uncharacterized protein